MTRGDPRHFSDLGRLLFSTISRRLWRNKR